MSGIVAGVVAENIDPDEARLALRSLETLGFSVIPVPALPDGDVAAAVAAFVTAIAPLVQIDVLADPAFRAVLEATTRPSVPPPAWFAQARRNAEARQSLLDEFGALSSEDIADVAGSRATNRRATAHRWQTEKKIFAVQHHGQVLYPGFQFDSETGRPKPAVAKTLAVLPSSMTGWALGLWWTTPVDTLDWSRPVDVLDTKTREVVRAAQVEANDWAQAAPA